MQTTRKITSLEKWEQALTHYFRKGFLTLTFYTHGLKKAWVEKTNPFSQTIQKTICYGALKKKNTLHSEFIDKVYEDMTLLFASESRDDGEGEKLDDVYFDNLYLICSQHNYDIDLYRKAIYEIRSKLEQHNKGEWSLKQVLNILVKELDSFYEFDGDTGL